jgi:hypothetical protein
VQVQEKPGKILKFCSFIIVITALLGILHTPSALAGCFDFSTRITQPLRNPTNTDASGQAPQGWVWATVHGSVRASLEAVLKDLEAHGTTKSSRVNKMEISALKDPRYLNKHEAHFEVDPFPFVSVKWTETWAFMILDGTADRPKKVLVSYEKTEGTSHIEHLCGNYLLERQGDGTGVFIYEEAKATNRTEKDTMDGLKGNLKALDGLKN